MEVVRSIADPIVPRISFTVDTPGRVFRKERKSLQEGQVLETDQAWESREIKLTGQMVSMIPPPPGDTEVVKSLKRKRR